MTPPTAVQPFQGTPGNFSGYSQFGVTGGVHKWMLLENRLEALVLKSGASWLSFDNVAGVQWRDSAPLGNPDTSDPDTARYRSGNLLLTDFGMAEVPDGQAGSEADTKQDNEGNAGMTLNDDAGNVQFVMLLKFYPSGNYAEILQQQIGARDSLELIADQCELDFDSTAKKHAK